MTFKQFKHEITQAILNIRIRRAIRRAKRYHQRIGGRESVHVFMQRKRFVILTRSHTRSLIRKKGIFKPGLNWSDIKANAIYTIEKDNYPINFTKCLLHAAT
ncbi:MAG: hypothetical protein LBU42_07685 [Prevotellaceae bacterium]|jgi:hypothetical protein|nr:hypothetical protein [Prevotellaceae bacterium]